MESKEMKRADVRRGDETDVEEGRGENRKDTYDAEREREREIKDQSRRERPERGRGDMKRGVGTHEDKREERRRRIRTWQRPRKRTR